MAGLMRKTPLTETARDAEQLNDRDNRDSRETAVRSREKRPGMKPRNRRNRSGLYPRFELFQDVPGYANGVYWIVIGKDTGQLESTWICSPLTIAATTRDATSNQWGRLLVFPDRDGREHRWAMPMSMLSAGGEELRSELLNQGLEISCEPRLRYRLTEYIQSTAANKTARCVTRTGWHGNVFVTPSASYGDTEAERVIFQTTDPNGAALAGAGTLDEWQQHVSVRCIGNSRLIAAISAGFAAICIGLVDVEGGGIHFRGGSSSGKTTALRVAASFYGSSDYALTWRNTDNALEAIAVLRSDMLLILDEISQLDPKHAGQCAYLLANGQGKGRAARDGSARAASTFRLLFLSAGEVGLSALVAENGGTPRAGQEVRVVEIPADAGAGLGMFDRVPEGMAPGQFADELKAAAATYYGRPLPAFLHRLVANVDAARGALREMRDATANSWLEGATDGQVRRVAQRLALIAAAGELATDYELTGWPKGEATRAMHACFNAWLAARGSIGNAEPLQILANVRAFLALHSESRFTDWDTDGLRTANRVGYRKRTEHGYIHYVEPEAFRREIAAGFNFKDVARVLVEHGALAKESDGGTTRTERLPDGRSMRVYKILPTLWDEPFL
jgi:putative DNA primase/helicase